MEDSIYISKYDNQIGNSVLHKVRESDLNVSGALGVYNINLERRSVQGADGNNIYYFPLSGLLSYNSIVTQNKVSDTNIADYLDDNDDLAKIYYTALGRERYGLYRPKLEI